MSAPNVSLRQHLRPVLQYGHLEAHRPGRRGRAPGHMAAAADHQPDRRREGLAETGARGQRSQTRRRSSSAAPGPKIRCQGTLQPGALARPAAAAGGSGKIHISRPHLQWHTASNTPPPMARALSEMVKQFSRTQRASTSPALKPARGTRVPAGRIPRRQPVMAADHRLTGHPGHRLPGFYRDRRWTSTAQTGRGRACGAPAPRCSPPHCREYRCSGRAQP